MTKNILCRTKQNISKDLRKMTLAQQLCIVMQGIRDIGWVICGGFHYMGLTWNLSHVSRVVHNCYAPITPQDLIRGKTNMSANQLQCL
jgi:hypothetical protein